jgi:acetolactate synthase-1/2/3 large subunit
VLCEDFLALLAGNGLEVCFANPGTTELPLVEALAAVPNIRPVLCLHENVATGAADGYGRIAHKPAATLLHLGPGLANGVANLHNAKKAGSPVINLIGAMPTWHAGATNSGLAFDVERLASTVSRSVEVLSAAGPVDLDRPQSFRSGENNVHTFLLPVDLQRADGALVPRRTARRSAFPAMDTVASDLRSRKSAIYVGGVVATAEVVRWLGRLGLPILVSNAFGRVDRGRGLPPMRRVPYWPREQAALLNSYDCLLMVGAVVPQALFGHEEQSEIIAKDKIVHQLIGTQGEIVDFIGQLAAILDQPEPRHESPALPPLPSGPLDPQKLSQVVAALQPEGAIVVDESISSGGYYWELSAGCAPFSHLALSGGATGYGMAASVGAAIAAPDRRVINLQGDGSAMYCPQALWTQARENLDVVTIICANRGYNILKIEMAMEARATMPSDATRRLLEMEDPAIQWSMLARSLGVRASRTSDAGELAEMLRTACSSRGPTLIEACW